jgi:hypothetical protein
MANTTTAKKVRTFFIIPDPFGVKSSFSLSSRRASMECNGYKKAINEISGSDVGGLWRLLQFSLVRYSFSRIFILAKYR